LTIVGSVVLTGMATSAWSSPKDGPAGCRLMPSVDPFAPRSSQKNRLGGKNRGEAVRRARLPLRDGGNGLRPVPREWLPDPAEAVEYLNRLGLDALPSMRGASLWYVPGLVRPFDGEAFDRALDLRYLSADILRISSVA
jgi:hypothetical protein